MKFIKSLCTLAFISAASCLADEHSSTVKLSFKKQYGRSFHEATSDKRHGNDDDEIPLKNNQNTYYSVDLALGTPGQEISILLDTGSSDLWVPQAGAAQCPSDSSSDSDLTKQTLNRDSISPYFNGKIREYKSPFYSKRQNSSLAPTGTFSVLSPSSTGSDTSDVASNDCGFTGYFDPGKSKTFQKNHTDPYYIQYGDSTYASGYWATDDLTVSQLKVHNVSFAVANQTNTTVSVFGIGFAGGETSYWGAAHPHKYPNFPELLKDQGIIQKVAYSLYLDSPEATTGNVLFGGVDKSQYKGQLYSFPILTPGDLDEDEDAYHRLAIALDDVSVNGSKHRSNATSVPVLLDSGTTDVYLPIEFTDSIASKFNGVWVPDIASYTVDCPKGKEKISFIFGPLTIETDINNYIYKDGDQCILGIYPSPGGLSILGDSFLVDAYVVYDLEGKQIALAQASFDSSKQDIVPVTSSGIPGAIEGSN